MSAWYEREMARAASSENYGTTYRVPRREMPPAKPRFVCVKQCSCGVRYDAAGWAALKPVGKQDDGAGGFLDQRNCPFCGSTISIQGRP